MSIKLVPKQHKTSDRWEPVLDAKGREVPYLRRYRDTGMIYVRKTFKAQGIPPLFKSTGETTLGRAKTAADQLVHRWKNEHLGIDDAQVMGRAKVSPDRTVRAAAEWVLENETPNRGEATQFKHRYYIGLIVDEWGSYPLDALTLDDFHRWIMRLRQKKFGPNLEPGTRGYRPARLRKSFEDFSKHLNLIYRHAYARKKIRHLMVFPNPDKALIAGRKERARRYTDRELIALWGVLSEDMRDQFVLAAECYMRLREALKLTWDRVDLESGRVTLRAQDVKTGSKTGRGRIFILSPLALERIRARYARRNPRSPYLFPHRFDVNRPRGSNRTAWDSVKARAGVVGRGTWHHLRHTAISKATLGGQVEPIKVSEYAGVSLQTLQRTYLHSRPDETAAAGRAAQLPIGCERGVNGKRAKSQVSKRKRK